MIFALSASGFLWQLGCPLFYLTTHINIEATGNGCWGTGPPLISQQVIKSFVEVKCHVGQKVQ